MTRRGKMLYAVLDDGSAQVEVAIFNELYEQHRNRLKEDRLVIIHGKVSNDDYSGGLRVRSEEHTSELQSLMRISYAVFCLKKKIITYCTCKNILLSMSNQHHSTQSTQPTLIYQTI